MWLATGHTDMRKGSLSLQVQEVLRRDHHLFCFRGRRGDLLKVIWHDGQGACLFTKKLERGRFVWPSLANGVVSISQAQMSSISWSWSLSLSLSLSLSSSSSLRPRGERD